MKIDNISSPKELKEEAVISQMNLLAQVISNGFNETFEYAEKADQKFLTNFKGASDEELFEAIEKLQHAL